MAWSEPSIQDNKAARLISAKVTPINTATLTPILRNVPESSAVRYCTSLLPLVVVEKS